MRLMVEPSASAHTTSLRAGRKKVRCVVVTHSLVVNRRLSTSRRVAPGGVFRPAIERAQPTDRKQQRGYSVGGRGAQAQARGIAASDLGCRVATHCAPLEPLDEDGTSRDSWMQRSASRQTVREFR
jgi:hypothetical protein